MKRQADSFPSKTTLNAGAVVIGIVLVALLFLVLQVNARGVYRDICPTRCGATFC